MEKLVKHIDRESLDFDTAFLMEFLEEHKKVLRLSEATGVHISPANKDLEDDVPAPKDHPTL